MVSAGVLTFWEFAMREPLPLAQIQEAVIEFLRGREDVALFGAQAVNAYVGEARMTQEIDLLSTRAKDLADELREHLSQKFHVAVRVREIAGRKGFRLYQAQKTGSRHLVDLRRVEELPDTQTIEDIQVLSPVSLIAICSAHQEVNVLSVPPAVAGGFLRSYVARNPPATVGGTDCPSHT